MSRPCPDPASHGAGARISCSTGWSWCSEISRKFAVVCCAKIRSGAHKVKEMFPWITPLQSGEGQGIHSPPACMAHVSPWCSHTSNSCMEGTTQVTTSKIRDAISTKQAQNSLLSKNHRLTVPSLKCGYLRSMRNTSFFPILTSLKKNKCTYFHVQIV